MSDFDVALRGFAALDEEALARPWSWRDKAMDVRFALYRTLEDAQETHVRVAAAPMPEARRIMALAQRAFGDLRGLLAGLPADVLDRAPGAGEWPLRETLKHMLLVERRYAVQTRYAVERKDSEPVRIPDDRQPTVTAKDGEGEVDTIVARIGAALADTSQWLGGVGGPAMSRPTIWAGLDVDVRFRLHRFAAHIVEHTIQIEKSLAVLGWRATEGRRITRHVAAAIAEIEGLGALADARVLEAVLAERHASIGA
jgi:DinB family protein